MTQDADDAAMALAILKQAVADALERKRLLGQYAVVWRDGKVVRIRPAAPTLEYPSSAESARAPRNVAEPGEEQ